MQNSTSNDKQIKKSRRGLTFSFPSAGRLSVGSHYDYVIEKASRSIRIVPAEAGQYKISRKKNGKIWSSLVDLRNKEILDAVAEMEQLYVHISDDQIIVSDGKVHTGAVSKKTSPIIVFQRADLARLRMAAGLDDISAAGRILEYTQISLDEYLAESQDPLSVSTVQKDIADIYTVVSLFSGAGILDWPFAQDPKFSIRYAIDYDAAACETYRKNIGMHIVHGDIHKAFTQAGYPLDETVSDPDIIIGGPSCKPFSNANRHTRLDDHPDSDLIVQYMRIVKTLKPKVFAMENVPEVLTACGGAYFDAIKETVKECGYELGANIVQDSKVGGYTTRKRAVILGSRIGAVSFPPLELTSGIHTAGEALGKVTPEWSNYSDVTLPGADTKKRMSFVPQGGNYQDIPEEYRTNSKNRHSCTYRRLAWNEPSPTIGQLAETAADSSSGGPDSDCGRSKSSPGPAGRFSHLRYSWAETAAGRELRACRTRPVYQERGVSPAAEGDTASAVRFYGLIHGGERYGDRYWRNPHSLLFVNLRVGQEVCSSELRAHDA